jgi:hypothetical protein
MSPKKVVIAAGALIENRFGNPGGFRNPLRRGRPPLSAEQLARDIRLLIV